MKKRRHHHVWQHYLHPWANAGTLFCLSRNRIFPTGTTVIAVEKDFYKLHELSEAEASFALEVVCRDIHPHARLINERFLDMVLAPVRFVRTLDDVPNMPDISAWLDEYKSNALEDYHAGIEGKFIPFLARMQSGDISFFHDDTGSIDLINFICLQYLRTKPIRDRTLARIKDNVGIDLSKAWGLISIMLATNLGGNLYVERRNRTLAIVENDTGVEFLTSDQPVFNIYAEAEDAPTKLVLYYPITPTKAVVLSEENEAPLFTTQTLTAQRVLELNNIIVGASHSQIFGRSEASLEPYLK